MGEQYSAIFTPLNRLFSHLRDKLESLHMEPTLADPNDIREAIKNLPAALPEVGYDVSQTIKFVEHTILPALAPGHAGPRFVARATRKQSVAVNWARAAILGLSQAELYLPR